MSDFTCDCCSSNAAANFCIVIFYVYLLIICALFTVQFYYMYRRSKGKADFKVIGSRKN